MTAPTDKDTVSSTEAAKELGVHRNTILRWLSLGILRGGKKGPGKTSPKKVSRQSVEQLKRELESSPSNK